MLGSLMLKRGFGFRAILESSFRLITVRAGFRIYFGGCTVVTAYSPKYYSKVPWTLVKNSQKKYLFLSVPYSYSKVPVLLASICALEVPRATPILATSPRALRAPGVSRLS